MNIGELKVVLERPSLSLSMLYWKGAITMENQKLTSRMHLATIAMALIMVISLLVAAVQPALAAGAAAAKSGRLEVLSVVSGESVSIRVSGMAANTPVTVRMGAAVNKGRAGEIVGTAVTSGEGSWRATYAIPAALKAQKKLAILVEATADISQFAYQSFVNVSKGKTTTVSGGSSSSAGSIPSGSSLSAGNITITDVVEDKSVTIKVTGAPANGRLAVWIDWNNRNGVMQGRQAGTVKVASNGSLSATIKLPSAAVDRGTLRVRLQGLDGSTYLAYRWFINAKSDSDTGSGAPATSTGGIPYVVVISVDENDSVKLKAFNFPKGEYIILMDEVGSGAKHGIEVDTVTIKAGRTFTGTFEIPNELEGEDEIAIRVQNVDESAYFAYTWFDNESD